jgi:hypothetical protein
MSSKLYSTIIYLPNSGRSQYIAIGYFSCRPRLFPTKPLESEKPHTTPTKPIACFSEEEEEEEEEEGNGTGPALEGLAVAAEIEHGCPPIP